MGTRASFFIHDPRDLTNRVWLGCIAWDGYPDTASGLWKYFQKVKTVTGFKRAVTRISKDREDFAYPNRHSFPFPWKNDLFLTDYTYAWFDGEIQMTCFHAGFVSLSRYATDENFRLEYQERHGDSLPGNVPAPISDDKPGGPDSIMILR